MLCCGEIEKQRNNDANKSQFALVIQKTSYCSPFKTCALVCVVTDIFSEVGASRNHRSSNKRIVTKRPPLVDSALLRFLSKQKTLKEQQTNATDSASTSTSTSTSAGIDNQRTEHPASKSVTATTNQSLTDSFEQSRPTPQSPQAKYASSQPTTTRQQQSTDNCSSSSSSDDTPLAATRTAAAAAAAASPIVTPIISDSGILPRAEDSLDLWMGQFNRNRIAQVLLARGSEGEGGGVDEQLANQAGEAVQRHALARTARRRVRDFLKARDKMWSGDISVRTNVTTTTTTDIAEKDTLLSFSASQSKQPDYGFPDVVDVLVDNGLTAKDVATILIHTPSIAIMMPQRPKFMVEEDDELDGETVEETVQRALSDLLCGTLKLRRYDARKVLRNCPGLLTKRGSRSAQQVVASMVKLGVSTSSIARDKNALPVLLSRPPAALFRLIAFLSSDAIRMPLDKIGPLIRRSECSQLLDIVAPLPRLAQDAGMMTSSNTPPSQPQPTQEETDSELTDARILPSFVGRTIEERRKSIDGTYDRMSTTAWTLRNKIGTNDLSKVISAYPGVLLLDASEQVLPVASYLMDELGIFQDDLARVLQLYPALLGMPISEMKETVDFIMEQGIEKENLASMFRSFPSLLTLSIEEDMKPVVQFLQSVGINNTGRFISRLPPVLGYSVSRELTPKWEFVQKIYTYTSFEVSKFPAFFSYPLERVIKARFEYLRDVKRLPISLIAPDLVLRYGDRDFAMRVAGDEDQGARFLEFLKARQSSSSSVSGKGRHQRQQRKKSAKNPKAWKTPEP